MMNKNWSLLGSNCLHKLLFVLDIGFTPREFVHTTGRASGLALSLPLKESQSAKCLVSFLGGQFTTVVTTSCLGESKHTFPDSHKRSS